MTDDTIDQLIQYHEVCLTILREARDKVSGGSASKPMEKIEQDDLILCGIDLEGWYLVYKEAAYPAKYMGAWELGPGEPENLGKREGLRLSAALKKLEGTPVNGGTHVWHCLGRTAQKGAGPLNLYCCIPIGDIAEA